LLIRVTGCDRSAIQYNFTSIKDDPMRRSRNEFAVRLAVLAIAFSFNFPTAESCAQLKGIKSSLDLGIGQSGSQAAPYKLSSRFHLMEGTTSGYLVVQVELEPGSYIYSLSQTGAINPTKIQVVPSEAFFIDGKFNPDRPAEVVENDPVFNQRVEKHKGKVQFFVPVKFNSVESVSQVQPEVILNGQICSTHGVFLPIREKRVKAEFGGFFGRTVESPAAEGATSLR
jgi:thiol:disulfide interchange protein